MSLLDKLKQAIGVGSSPATGSPGQRIVRAGDIQHSSDWGGFASDSVVYGLEFSATIQYRTPLRVLTQHGAIHKDRNSPPPRYAKEEWEGIWLPKTDPKFDFLREGATIASDFGSIPSDGGDFLPWLIEVRKVVESGGSVQDRRATLIDLDKAQGRALADIYFPPFLESIKGLSDSSVAELKRLGLTTPAALDNSPDDELTSIKGVGPAKLNAIRQTCAAAEDKTCEWIESDAARTR